MGRLQDIVKTISKGLQHPEHVLEGIVNDIKLENGSLSENEVNLILKRRVICEECPLNSFKAKTSQEYFELYGKHYESTIDSLHCSICSCLITKKTACISCHCGLTEYNDKNPDNFQNLKW